ncbi:MAG: AAA family ATPase [Candidatus Riesia sp.]|nr:AAA family ATPase [Candidatus Riesia sp.]
MKQIIITIGISGSGKSTWAHREWLKDPDNIVIINRDKIRELLFGYSEETIKDYYLKANVGKLEKRVTKYEDTLINEALESDKTVIVDATHLKRSYLERFRYWNVSTYIISFPVDLEEAVRRDKARTRSVGEDVIKSQHDNYKSLMSSLKKESISFDVVTFDNEKIEGKTHCLIVDIDGTLAHKGDRSPYDWAAVGKDTKDIPTALLVSYMNAVKKEVVAPKIVICTGRDGVCLPETEQWLDDNHIPYDEIYIRKEGDMRADWIVKEEMWRKIAEDYYIIGMLDDRLQVVRRARALGLKVFNVEYNNF